MLFAVIIAGCIHRLDNLLEWGQYFWGQSSTLTPEILPQK